MDFRLGSKSDAFREEVSAFIADHVSDDMIERVAETGTAHNWDLHRAMGQRHWIAASWPVEYGGQGRDPYEMTALKDELRLAGAPLDGLGNSIIVGSTIRHVGTEEQKQTFLPPLLAGEYIFALGYSEPDSGSDVAAAKTRAVRDGDEWVINGQKMFTTLAHESKYVFLLARTNPDVPKHKGLTTFIVPLDTPGVEIQPVHTLGGERTNITFYTDVRVPDSLRVGAVDGGWDVMTVALTFERGGLGLSEADRLWRQTVDWAKSTRRDGKAVIEEPATRERLANMAIDNEVAKLLAYRVSWVTASGGLPGVEGSMHKLWYAERLNAAASELLDMLGEDGVLAPNADDAPVGGAVEHTYRHAPVTTIYGGSSEIQRSIIAERGLGLPPVPAVSTTTKAATSPFPGAPVVDGDGHVLEPRDLWERELPAKFRDVAIKVTWNEERQLEDEWVNGRCIVPGVATCNGWARMPRSVRDDPTGPRWEDLTPAGLCGEDRVIELDREGIDMAVLYPSLGLGIGGITDPEHATLACRVYNDWLADYCSAAPTRLIGVGAIPMQDPAAAAREAERCVRELGFRGVFVRPNPCGDLFAHHAVYDQLWETVQGLGVPVGLHPAGFPDTFGAAQTYGSLWQGITPLGKVINFMIDVVNTFTMMIAAGVMDRYPELKVIVLESGVGWLPWWLDKMDHWNLARLAGPSIQLKPSEYVARQIWVSGDPDESSFATVAAVAPANRLMWATDFPHLDILDDEPSATEELYERLASMPPEVAEAILGRNACELYGLDPAVAIA